MFLHNNIELCPILWRRVSLEKHQLHAANGFGRGLCGNTSRPPGSPRDQSRLGFFLFFSGGGRKLKEKKKGKAGSEELTCTRPVWTRGGTSSPPNQSTEKGMREAGEEEEEEEEKIRADTSGVRGRTEAAWGQSRTLSLLTYFYQHTHTHVRVCVCVCVCVCWESIWQVDED